MANTYCTATNFGKGFFTHEDRNDFYLSGHPGDVWVVGNNPAGVSWIQDSRVRKIKYLPIGNRNNVCRNISRHITCLRLNNRQCR